MERGQPVINVDRERRVLFKRLCRLFYYWGVLVGSTLII